MRQMRALAWERLAAMLICVGAGGVAVYLAFRFVLPFLLPFLIAWLLSLVLRRLARRLARRTGLSPATCAVLLLLVSLGGGLVLLGASVWRLVLELRHLLERLLAEGGGAVDWVTDSVDLFDALTSRIGFLHRVGAGERFVALRDAFNQTVADMIGGLLTSLTAAIPAFLAPIGCLPLHNITSLWVCQ